MAAAVQPPAPELWQRGEHAQVPLRDRPQLPVFEHRGTDRQALVNSPSRALLGGALRPRSAATPFASPRTSPRGRGRASTERRAHVNPSNHHIWQPRPLSVQSGRISGTSQGTGALPLPEKQVQRVEPGGQRAHLTPWLSHVSAHGDDRLAARWSATRTGQAAMQLTSPRSNSAFGNRSASGGSARKPRSARRQQQQQQQQHQQQRQQSHSQLGFSAESVSQRQLAAVLASGELAAPWSLATAKSLWEDDASTCETRRWLEDSLRKLLGSSGVGPAEAGANPPPIARVRISAVQNVFEHLVEEFRSCKQVLSAIKGEYDATLRYWINKHDGDKPRFDRSRSLRELMESELVQIHEEHDRDMRPLEDAIKTAREHMERAQRVAETKRAQLQAYKNDLGKAKQGLGETEETDHELLQVMRRVEKDLARKRAAWATDIGPKVRQLRENIEEKNSDIQLAKKHIAWARDETHKERSLLAHESKHQATTEAHCTDFAQEIEKLNLDAAKNRRLHQDLEEKMERVLKGSISTGRSTPRPLWDEAEDAVGVSMELKTQSLSTVEIVKQLTEHLKKENAALREAKEKAESMPEEELQANSKRRNNQQTEEKWHICRGTGPTVPKFLKRVGRVRNMQLTRRATESLIDDYWQAKIKHDSAPGAMKDSPPEYLYKFLVERCGGHGPAVEMGYNLADAVRRYSHDADCELFGRIIHEEICEEAYHHQMAQINGFMECCAQADAKEVGGLAESDGMLSRGIFLECVDRYFNLMRPPELRALKKALSYQYPLTPEVPYREVFESNEDGQQGKFAETMRDEHLYVLMQEYPNAENWIRKDMLESLQAKPKVTHMTDVDAQDWAQYTEVVQTVPMLSSFLPESMKLLMKQCEICEYNDGDHIIVQATTADTMYIMVSGVAIVQKDGVSKSSWSYANLNDRRGDGTKHPGGNFFGEGALLAPRRARATDPLLPMRGASIIATGDAGVTCMRVSRDAFLLASDADVAAQKTAIAQGRADAEINNVGITVARETDRMKAAYQEREDKDKASGTVTSKLHEAASNRIMSKAPRHGIVSKAAAMNVFADAPKANEVVSPPPAACQVRHVRSGLLRNDPKMPQEEINRIIAAGLQQDLDLVVEREKEKGGAGSSDINVGSPELFPSDMDIGALHQFMLNVKSTIVLKRFSQLPEESIEIQQEKFLRSLPAEEKEAIAEVFYSIDTDGSGSISTAELRMLLEDTYGMKPTHEQLSKLRAEIDSDGDGFITLEEFTKAMGTVTVLQKAGDMYKWKVMFLEADEDQGGALDFEEVCKLLDRVWAGDSDQLQLLKHQIKASDVDGDGEISWLEFAEAISSM